MVRYPGSQKRESARIVYPREDAAVIIETGYRVVDLSTRNIRFAATGSCSELYDLLESRNSMSLRIKLHEERVLQAECKILRQYYHPASHENYFVCLFTDEIPTEVVEREREYLLKNFPDFCKDVLWEN